MFSRVRRDDLEMERTSERRVRRGRRQPDDCTGSTKKKRNKAEWTPSGTHGGNYEVEEDNLKVEEYQEKRSRKMRKTSTKAER